MTHDYPVVADELDLLGGLVPLADARILEAGCGAARLARSLLDRHAGAEVTGLEVDDRQHALNLADPASRLHFMRAGAQEIPFPDASFDGAMMLKSLHHVPMALHDQALAELARVLKPGGWLYVSEPVFGGSFNELIRLFNDEQVVREAAQRTVDRAVASGRWTQVAEQRFGTPVHFRDFAEFERRQMRPSFADHRIDDAKLAQVEAVYAPHQTADGASFVAQMHLRLLRRAD